MKPTPKQEIIRQAWRRILHDMGDDVFEDYLTNEEQAMYFRKVSARLPDSDTTVEEALTEEDLVEILIDVLEETRGDDILG